MRSVTLVGFLLLAFWTPHVVASDFEETKQDVPDSALDASMQGPPDGIARDPQTIALENALRAHCACVRQSLKAGFGSAAISLRCVATRAAYADFLPRALANLQITQLEQRLVAAPTDAQ